MKTVLFYIIFLFILFKSVYSANFEFTPINLNFRAVEEKGDIFVTYGDMGSMMLSYDNAASWQQIRVFDKGSIVKIFIEDTSMVAFSDGGEISVSKDKGNTWATAGNLNETLESVIRFPNGYFIRAYTKLFTIKNDFTIEKNYGLISDNVVGYNPNGYSDTNLHNQYKYSITYFNKQLIAETKSAKYIRLDTNLNFIDTINFSKLGLCKSCGGSYQIYSDSVYFYCKVDTNIFRTQDFNTFEKVQSLTNYIHYYKIINHKIYFIEYPLFYDYTNENFTCKLFQVIGKDSVNKISEFVDADVTANIRPKDFTIGNNKLILIGDNKLIATINLNDTVPNIISEFSAGSIYSNPDKINDSTFLFYDGFYYGAYNNPFYITENKGLSLKPTVDTQINPDYKKYNTMRFKYFNALDKTLYYGGSNNYSSKGGVFISNNHGKNFNFKPVTNFDFSSVYGGMVPHIPCLPNIQKKDDYLISAYNYQYNLKHYTWICTFDKNFEQISRYKDSNIVLDYVYSKDTNTYLIHAANMLDSTFEFKYTSERGMNWEIIKKYQKSDSMLYYKEINFKNKTILVLFHFNRIDSICTIDAIDIDSRICNKIYEYKVNNPYNTDAVLKNGIFCDSNYIYIAIQDTFFYTYDLNDKNKWKYINFPDGGNIIRTCSKFGDTYFARYADSIHTDNIYWFTISNSNDTLTAKPLIMADDYAFGKVDIKNKDTATKILKISNPSRAADLIITGVSRLNDPVFFTNLPVIDSLNPILIKPGESYSYKAYFKPDSVGIHYDSYLFYSNASDSDNVVYLSGEGVDTIAAKVDYQVEEDVDYLYAFPPYPIPGYDQISFHLYWDLIDDIDNDEINVYNMLGAKVAGREKFTINKATLYDGYLTWDCSDVKAGPYFIQIKRGNYSRTVKVIVAR